MSREQQLVHHFALTENVHFRPAPRFWKCDPEQAGTSHQRDDIVGEALRFLANLSASSSMTGPMDRAFAIIASLVCWRAQLHRRPPQKLDKAATHEEGGDMPHPRRECAHVGGRA